MTSVTSVRRMQVAALVAATVLGPIGARGVAAQPGAVDARRARAKAHADAGIAAHDRGEYDKAIALYQKAYDELPHPALFFNMAQSHRLAGRPGEALALYRRYLQEAPSGALADQARTWVAALEAQRVSEPPEPPAPASPPSAESPAPSQQRGDRRDHRRLYRLGAYGAGGASLVAFGVGALYGFEASDISDELSEPNAVYSERRFDQGRAAERNMFVWYGVGGALLIGGAVLFVLGTRGGEEAAPAAALTPMLGPDGAGVAWSARF